MPLILLALGGIALFFLLSTDAFSGVKDVIEENIPTPTLDEIFQRWATIRGIDWKLIKAHAIVESSLDPSAVNETDNESIGLGQILCRPDGKGGCRNKLNVDGWSEATREKLLDPDFNTRISSGIIAANIEAFGLPRAIAVYNNWSAHTAPIDGPFPNQVYVDRVLKVYNDLTTQ